MNISNSNPKNFIIRQTSLRRSERHNYVCTEVSNDDETLCSVRRIGYQNIRFIKSTREDVMLCLSFDRYSIFCELVYHVIIANLIHLYK